MTQAQVSPKTQEPKATTKGSNGKTRWFGARLWDATREAVAHGVQRNQIRDGLATVDDEVRNAWVSAIAQEAKGNPKVAKLLVDFIQNAGDELATRIANQFIQLYSTLSQKDRARVFEKLVDEFCWHTSKSMFSEFKAVRLAKLIELIGNESNTTYKEDEGHLFTDNVDRLVVRLKEIVEDDFNDYHEHAAVRVAAARVVWAFDNDLESLDQRLHDKQTAEFAVETMMSTGEGRAMLVAKVLNGDAKLVAQVMASMPEDKTRSLLLGWIYGQDKRLAIYALNVVAMRKEISDGIKLVLKNKVNDKNADVKNAAVVAAVQHMMPEVIPHLKASLQTTTNIQIKDACIQAIARFAAQGSEDAKGIVLDILNGSDNTAKNLAIGYILVNKLTYTVPTMAALFENRKGDKEIRKNIEKAIVLFGFAGVAEAVQALPRIAKIRTQELNTRILELRHTAMQGKKDKREKAEAELQQYAKMGAKLASDALRQIEQARERSQPWKRRGKSVF